MLNIVRQVISDYEDVYQIRNNPYVFMLDDRRYEVALRPASTKIAPRHLQQPHLAEYLRRSGIEGEAGKTMLKGWTAFRHPWQTPQGPRTASDRRWYERWLSPWATQAQLNVEYTEPLLLSLYSGVEERKLRAWRAAPEDKDRLLTVHDKRLLNIHSTDRVDRRDPVRLEIRSDAAAYDVWFDPLRRVILAVREQ